MGESAPKPTPAFALASAPSLQERAERRVGAVLVGKYRLEAVLGVGGMAAVYRASHRNGNRVAIKMLHAEISADPDLRARFVREGYVANSIPHEGTVRVLDDDVTEDGAAFVVMDLLEGETLLEHAARRGGKASCEQAVAIGHRVLDVLVASHAAGVIHRDIKPENIFLTTEGVAHLLDFGVARMADASGSGATRTGRVMGTPAFMPPEQALGRGKEIDERSDLWAVGATIFTLVTGRYVHDAETPEEQVVKAATQPVGPIRELAPILPPAIAAVVDRALAFDKKDRFASAREMRDALGAAASEVYGAIPSLAKGSPTTEPRESIGHARTVDASDSDLTSGEAQSPAVRPFDTGGGRRQTPTRPSDRPPPAPRSSSLARATFGAGFVAVALALVWGATHRARPTSLPATPSAVIARPSVRCTANAQCAASDPSSICRKDTGACTPLKSPDCSELLAETADVENDATIWIGAMIPRHGLDGAHTGQVAVNTLDLARRDFVAVSNGVPGVSPMAPSRPIGVIVCDDFDAAATTAHHLVDDVGVPAVIGFGRTKSVLDLTPSLFDAKRVLALAALNTSPILTSVPVAADGTRFLWRVTSDAAAIASVFSAFATADLHPSLAPKGRSVKAAVVRVSNVATVSTGDAVVSSLRNVGADLATFALDGDHPDRDVLTTSAQIIDSEPDYIVTIGGGDTFVPALVVAIERGWPANRKRPRYMAISTGVLVDESIRQLAVASPEVRSRILAADTSSKLPANVKLALHYSELFTPKLTPATTFGPPYDAFYLLAYAVVAVGDAPVTGETLTRAIPRFLPPGQPVDIGPASILAVYNTLRAGKNVDLNGTTTTLDYDVATGDAPADLAIYCLKSSPERRGVEIGESGMVFDAKTQKLTGKLDCR
jgi:serine/threonine-protein kinase